MTATSTACDQHRAPVPHLHRRLARAERWIRRQGGNGFAYQGFNYPKSVWGGQLKAKMRKLEGDDRAAAYDELMGGTNTPVPRRWQAQMKQGRRRGLVPRDGGHGRAR